MINLDEVMQRTDMRTVSSGEIRRLFAEIERLRDIVAITVKALADIDSGHPDYRDIASKALRSLE